MLTHNENSLWSSLRQALPIRNAALTACLASANGTLPKLASHCIDMLACDVYNMLANKERHMLSNEEASQ
jgi:hypothetical protein